MKFTYESMGSGNYLVYELQENEQLDSMSLGMLTNNEIPGFAAVSFTQMDEKRYVKYNITSKVAASTLFQGPLSKKRLLTILSGIVNGLTVADDYMLDRASILLDLDHIYMDTLTNEPVMICLPVLQEGKEPVDLRTFFRDTVFNRAQFDRSEDCSYLASLLNYLNSVPNLSLADFKDLLTKLEQQKGGQVVQPLVDDGEDTDSEPDPDDGGDMTVIDESPTLTRRKTGEVINLSKPAFKLGREAGKVDYELKGNRSISRVHVTIHNKGGKYMAEDMKSSYYTFINGKQLLPHKPAQLRPGDVLKLSNEEFDFNVNGSGFMPRSPRAKIEKGKIEKGFGPAYDPIDGGKKPETQEEMSLWYLLNHFSKENLEKYNAQKDGRKPEKKSDGKKEKSASRKKKKDDSYDRGFALPGDPPPPLGEDGDNFDI